MFSNRRRHLRELCNTMLEKLRIVILCFGARLSPIYISARLQKYQYYDTCVYIFSSVNVGQRTDFKSSFLVDLVDFRPKLKKMTKYIVRLSAKRLKLSPWGEKYFHIIPDSPY